MTDPTSAAPSSQTPAAPTPAAPSPLPAPPPPPSAPVVAPPVVGRVRRSRAGWAWIRGTVLLGLMVWVFGFTQQPWHVLVGVWILGVVALDELGGGWFAYVGLPLGWLALLTISEPWWTVAPLLTGCLWVYLLLRHAGGVLALPLAVGGFVLPWALFQFLLPRIDRVGRVDPQFRVLLENPFQRNFIGSILLAAGLVLLNQLIVFIRARAKLRRDLQAARAPQFRQP